MLHPAQNSNDLTVHGSLEKVYAYFVQLPVAVAVFLGPEQIFDFVNDAYCQLIGKERAEVQGLSLFTVFPELRGSAIEGIHQRVMATGDTEHIDENPVSYQVKGRWYHGFFNTRFQPLKDDAGQTFGLLVSGYDVTETVVQKKQNEAREALLQKAREQIELSINTGKVGLWYWDALTNELTWSREQQELFGLAPDETVARIEDFHRFVVPEDLPAFNEGKELLQKSSADFNYKFRIRRKDGQIRWLEARSRTCYDEQGRLLFIAGINIDITEQEEMRHRLEASERRFRSVAENSPDVITRHGPDYRYLYISPQIESFTGLKPEAFVGKTYQEVGFPEQLCRFFDEALAFVFREKKPHQVSYSMPGDARFIFSRLTPEFDERGDVVSVLILSTDVTEIKKAEMTQRKLATQLQLATDSANVGTWLYDLEKGVLEWSALHKRMWGYPEEKEPLVLADWQNRLHPADLEGVLRIIEDARLQQQIYDATYRVINASDGSLRWIRSVGQYQFNEAGQAISLTGVSIDITEQKITEEKLRAKEEHFSLALEAASLGTYDLNPQTGCVHWSEKTRAWFGVGPEEEITYGHYYERIHPDDRERVHRATERSMTAGSDGTFDEEFRVISPEGEQVRWLRSKGHVFFDEAGAPVRFIGVVQDVSQSKEMMAEVAEGRKRLQAALNASATGTFRWNITTNDLSWDENLDRLFGLPPGNTVRSLHQFISCVHPDDRPLVIAACERCAVEAADFDQEFRVVWPDGSIHWLDDKGKTFVDEQGHPEFMTGACVDITERKHFEQVLSANEERFRTLGNSIAQLAWMADASGYIYWYNDRWYAYTGTDLESMKGWGWQKVHHPDHVDRVVAFVKEAWQHDAPWELTFPLRRHDGEYRWFLTRAYPVKDAEGNIVQWIGTNTDIDEHLETQRALKQSEEQLRVLADFLPQVVWTTDSGGQVNYFNKRWSEYTGKTLEHSSGSQWMAVLHPDDLQRTTEVWARSVQAGIYYEVEYRLRRHDGMYRWFLARGLPLRNEQGMVEQWFGTCTDIHDRKAISVQLEALVQERTRALQRSNEDLQQFAHVASHDLKEPVRKIKTFAGMLEAEISSQLNERSSLFLNKIFSATDRMFSMINGVLTYSAVGGVEQAFEPVDLNETVGQIAQDLEVLIREKRAKIEAGQLPVVNGVPVLLYQLFYNLVNNSLKFSRAEVALEVRITADRAERNNQSCHRIVLSDNGIGFEQEFAEQIFFTFTRLHSKDKYEGTGLGLALCKKIVERHGGSITATGVAGEGARFTILLPA